MGNNRTHAMTRDAFAVLVERHQHTFLRGLVGQEEPARDLVQDTFHDAWRLAQKQSPPGIAPLDDDGVRRWLFHTAYCRAISVLRRRRYVQWESLEGAVELLAAEVACSALPTVQSTPAPGITKLAYASCL